MGRIVILLIACLIIVGGIGTVSYNQPQEVVGVEQVFCREVPTVYTETHARKTNVLPMIGTSPTMIAPLPKSIPNQETIKEVEK